LRHTPFNRHVASTFSWNQGNQRLLSGQVFAKRRKDKDITVGGNVVGGTGNHATMTSSVTTWWQKKCVVSLRSDASNEVMLLAIWKLQNIDSSQVK
jgi:hypothetical protein